MTDLITGKSMEHVTSTEPNGATQTGPLDYCQYQWSTPLQRIRMNDPPNKQQRLDNVKASPHVPCTTAQINFFDGMGVLSNGSHHSQPSLLLVNKVQPKLPKSEGDHIVTGLRQSKPF